ncbi:MAG: hypothetical protein JSV84_14710 [Gemmatimonadota bacterium]|nr:MAG: hypothetical protein JSV84_14710 [Gemmatimonadota bacterium]
MRISTVILPIIMLLFTFFVDLDAQEELELAPGSRIRISTPISQSGEIIESFVSLDADTLQLKN